MGRGIELVATGVSYQQFIFEKRAGNWLIIGQYVSGVSCEVKCKTG